MKDNRMDNIVECAYNMDNGYVEVWFTDGNMLQIKCEEVEAALRTTEQSLAKLHKLLDNKPIEYVMQWLCPGKCRHIVILRMRWLRECSERLCKGI